MKKSIVECFDFKHARVLFVVAVVWTCCASSVTSNDDGSVAYPRVPETSTFGPYDRPALWQLPEGPVEKVLVIFTGRNSHPGVYWDYSPGCTTCIGCPESRHIVADALSRNYAVFVPDPVHKNWGYWPEDNPDVLSVQAMITEWKHVQGLQGLPTMGIGISMGGWILSTVALRPGFFDAICLMISAGIDDAIEASTSQYPPTIIVQMPRDTRIAPKVPITRRTLESRGVPTAEVQWNPQPLTPDWFSRSILGVNLRLSTEIFNCVKSGGWLDRKNFLVSGTYRRSIPNEVRQCDIDLGDQSQWLLNEAITAELDVAYAYHCTISVKDDEIFAFFDGNYQSGDKSISPLEGLLPSASHLPS